VAEGVRRKVIWKPKIYYFNSPKLLQLILLVSCGEGRFDRWEVKKIR
jgi:hypothetical protein